VAAVCVAAGPSLPGGRVRYERTKELSGMVTSVKFTNLHSSLALPQRGIGKTGPNSLHTGDEIKVKFLPARDRESAALPQDLITPDGRVIQISACNPNE